MQNDMRMEMKELNLLSSIYKLMSKVGDAKNLEL